MERITKRSLVILPKKGVLLRAPTSLQTSTMDQLLSELDKVRQIASASTGNTGTFAVRCRVNCLALVKEIARRRTESPDCYREGVA